MGTYAKVYIAAVLAGGMACFVYAMAGWRCEYPLQYLCLLAVALPASALKVFLPGVTGTMSVSYVFVLLGMLDFSYPETVLLSCLAMIVQSLWRTKYHPRVLHVFFNLASTAIAVSFGFATYHLIAGQGQVLLSVAIASTVYFLTNSLSVAAVVAVTEGKSLRKIWHEYYLWTFPYYLVGGGGCDPDQLVQPACRVGDHGAGPTGSLRDLPFVPALPGAARIREEPRRGDG